MLLTDNEDNYINMSMQDAYNKLNGKNNDLPGFFSYEIFSKLPTISFDFFTQNEDDNFNKLIKEVLIHSKLYNHYNEVQITYDINKILQDVGDYVPVYGTHNDVKFYSDPRTKEIIDNAEGLLVVSLHNHTDNTDFSLKDLLAFSGINKIKIMAVVNIEGEVSILYRTKECDLLPIIIKYFDEITNGEKQFNLESVELLTPTEKKYIKDNFYKEIEDYGCEYIPFIKKNDNRSIINTDQKII